MINMYATGKSIIKMTFHLLCVFLIVSASAQTDHSGHHDHEHPKAHGSITVIAKETTRTPVHENHLSHASSDDNFTTVTADVHEHHKLMTHDQHAATNHDMHHTMHGMHHDMPKIAGDQEMVLDQAPSNAKKLEVDSNDEPAGRNLNAMSHQSNDMDHMNHNNGDMDMDQHKDHDMHNMEMGSNSSMPHMMMVFHIGISEVVLFKEWKIKTLAEMIASVLGIILLAMFYEGLKYFREHLFKQYISSMQFSTVAVTGESGRATQIHKIERHQMMSLAHVIQTGLHVVQLVISYFLMLIFMTYNVWLCLAVIIGSAIGFFAFGWKKATVVDITEHCH